VSIRTRWVKPPKTRNDDGRLVGGGDHIDDVGVRNDFGEADRYPHNRCFGPCFRACVQSDQTAHAMFLLQRLN
jgi:hypothetical protein